MSELADHQGERFLATGEAADVVQADEAAWSALRSKLGRDPLNAWQLTQMTHTFMGEDEPVAWTAIFVRDPDVEIPPPTAREFESVTDQEVQRFKKGGR